MMILIWLLLSPVALLAHPKLLDLDPNDPSTEQLLESFTSSHPFPIPMDLFPSLTTANCWTKLLAADISTDPDTEGTVNPVKIFNFEYTVECPDANAVCLMSSLEHHPTLPNRSNMFVSLLHGQVPHKCPSGRELLKYHEWVALKYIGVTKSKLLDASKISAIRSRGPMDITRDLTGVDLRSSVWLVLLSPTLPKGYLSYYTLSGYLPVYEANYSEAMALHAIEYVYQLTPEQLGQELLDNEDGRSIHALLDRYPHYPTISSLIRFLYTSWMSSPIHRFDVQIETIEFQHMLDCVRLVKMVFEKKALYHYGSAIKQGETLSWSLSNLSGYRLLYKDLTS